MDAGLLHHGLAVRRPRARTRRPRRPPMLGRVCEVVTRELCLCVCMSRSQRWRTRLNHRHRHALYNFAAARFKTPHALLLRCAPANLDGRPPVLFPCGHGFAASSAPRALVSSPPSLIPRSRELVAAAAPPATLCSRNSTLCCSPHPQCHPRALSLLSRRKV